MMLSEFVERTGFTPIGEEYREIENEYMEADIDKDIFCKKWVKDGGIQRYTYARGKRIEELEAELKASQKKHEEDYEIQKELIAALNSKLERYKKFHDEDMKEMEDLQIRNENLNRERADAIIKLRKVKYALETLRAIEEADF